ncbi:MAG: methionine aminotransferase [Burkholderiaceae bacterium]
MQSRLPMVGTNIFTVMSALAAESGAVNLGQGFPDFDPDPVLIDHVAQAMRSGHNQYAPLNGVPMLRERLSEKIRQLYGHAYCADTEIMITAGATQAVFTALMALTQPGDEVLVIEPAFDSYVPGIVLAGGHPVSVPMTRDYRVDWDRIRSAVTAKTRLILVNSPHNPSGLILSDADMRALESIVMDTGLWVISDEVYEHMVFDGRCHQSAARYPALASRTVVVSSFGKTFHVTGWKMGFVAAPTRLMTEYRKVHQFNVFVANSAVQVGLAHYTADPQRYLALPDFYQRKRDFFRQGLLVTPLRLYPCEGTFFQMVDYSAVPSLSGKREREACEWLTREVGVAAIPLSSFYQVPTENCTIRFCFAKRDDTLQTGLDRLQQRLV